MSDETRDVAAMIRRLSGELLADDGARRYVFAFVESVGDLVSRAPGQTSLAERAQRRVLPRIRRQLTATPGFDQRFQLEDLTHQQRDAVVSAAIVLAADDFMLQQFRNLGIPAAMSREEIKSLSGAVPAVSYTWGVIYGELGELYAGAEQNAVAEMGNGGTLA